MRIEHPDTYVCDICGIELEHATRMKVPVLHDLVANEYGSKKRDDPYVVPIELDMCDECLMRVACIRQVPKFYENDSYDFID